MVTRELINDFRERINKNNYILNKYRNIDGKNKWSCICSCMDWISVSITYLAKNPLPIFTDNDDITSVNVYTYISCVDMVFEAVSQLHRIFVSEKSLPFEKESTIFADNFSCKDDNAYFKLIRACFGAHPVNLNDYFRSGDSKERRFASWSGGCFGKRDYSVILYSNLPDVEDIFFDISFKEISEFLIRTYSYLRKLINLIDEDEENTQKALKAKIITYNDDPIIQLDIFDCENRLRYNNDYYKQIIDELRVIFRTQINNPDNKIKVEQYRESLKTTIEELRTALQSMELQDIESYDESAYFRCGLPHSVSSGFVELANCVLADTFSYPIFLPSLIEYISKVVIISGSETDEELYVLAKTAFYQLDKKLKPESPNKGNLHES